MYCSSCVHLLVNCQCFVSLVYIVMLYRHCSLAKDVCCQIEDRLCKAHAGFENSMQRLEKSYNGRLRETESQSLSLRKKLAPRIARLALESRSLRDFVMHGQLNQLISFILFHSAWSSYTVYSWMKLNKYKFKWNLYCDRFVHRHYNAVNVSSCCDCILCRKC